ncbi:hypothetical protein [uncultured Anaerococcus sp.]|uniref:hypothetical protein n=1 Tax=uncultured Anaerococcus sp. TaxID=293428 RepID=UPI0025DC0BCA|nr:hypothetical protein [uncultured Anaerococcus sp.]
MSFLNQIKDYFDNHIWIFNLLVLLITCLLYYLVNDSFLDKVKASNFFKDRIISYYIFEFIVFTMPYCVLKLCLTTKDLPSLKDLIFYLFVYLFLNRSEIKEDIKKRKGKEN